VPIVHLESQGATSTCIVEACLVACASTYSASTFAWRMC